MPPKGKSGGDSAPKEEQATIQRKSRKKARTAASGRATHAQLSWDDDGDGDDGEDEDEDEDEDEEFSLSTDAPIHEIPDMFADLVRRVPQIKEVAAHVAGRKLRVATMCSGTESPLLALDLIVQFVSELYKVEIDVEHVFSCEIEPFKQAYIERNFHPPLLFTDVCELGRSHATTAYGAEAPVPGDVDLLVAGTSCVDYSSLNNRKKGIDGGGESGRTFRGMLDWVEKHKPPIVILENVCKAPWERVVDYFKSVGYSAEYMRVDTKHFYIPHTRTRVYLVAVNQEHSNIPTEWKEMVASLKRPTSSTLDAFLLPSDDPRIHLSRQKLLKEGRGGDDKTRAKTDWSRCESRHERIRVEEGLGNKCPLTGWRDGACKLPDFAWNDWGKGQVERVLDLMDIGFLLDAKHGIDASYKTKVWNLSQNVDRGATVNKLLGISPCLTPTMIPYITNRGGPMVGLEALGMQGLPVDKLLLTRESERDLADLAGNAMTTTVVGACILSALIKSKPLLKAGGDVESYERKGNTKMAALIRRTDSDAASSADEFLLHASTPPEERVGGISQLVKTDIDLSSTNIYDFHEMLEAAARSARLCECEGRKGVTSRKILRCIDCNDTSCEDCGGRPEHNMSPIAFPTDSRLQPSAFSKLLKAALPMRLFVAGLTKGMLDGLKRSVGVDITQSRWAPWCTVVLRAVEDELRFVELKRREIWSAVYRSPRAMLELLLRPQRVEWRFHVLPPVTEGVNSDLRQMLQLPVARLFCNNALLAGHWEVALPYATSFDVSIKGIGDLVPSWEARLGLTDELADSKVWSRVQVSVPTDRAAHLERDIAGTYELLDRCGTACGALHKKISCDQNEALPALFMLLDPGRCSDRSKDSFIFSTSKRRHEFGEARPIICALDATWRPTQDPGERSVACRLPVLWTAAPCIVLEPSRKRDASCFVPSQKLDVDASPDSCRRAHALFVGEVDLCNQAGPEWAKTGWREVDKVHERQTYRQLSFLTERIRVGDTFTEWQEVEPAMALSNCERCAPMRPALRWVRKDKKFVGVEDSIQAGEYERRLKQRPSPFITQLKLDQSGVGHIRIGINIISLLHRALACLPLEGCTEAPTLTWRLDTDYAPTAKLASPKFKLESNKLDTEHVQPPHFILPLRKEQRRSLEWMIRQESPDAAPFVEAEISEAVLEPLGWRAEGRAQRPVHIRGGVLADQVGYGKTAITLGLIDCAPKDAQQLLERQQQQHMTGKIPVMATLIVVPGHLCMQWASEIEKFTGDHFNTLVLYTTKNVNMLTIKAVQEADIIIMASNLFRSKAYMSNLEAFAAGGALPSSPGRYFDACLNRSLESLAKQVQRLQSGGPEVVMQEIIAARTRAEKQSVMPTKRLRGKFYHEASQSKMTEDSEAEADANVAPVPVASTSQSAYTKPSHETTTDLRGGHDADASASEPEDIRGVKRKASAISESENDTIEDGMNDHTEDATLEGVRSHPATSGTSEDCDDECTDEPSDTNRNSPGVTRPVKSKGETKAEPRARPAGKRKRREDTDPWKLKKPQVKKDWTQMKSPPLQMFFFARTVVDEYTYLNPIDHAMLVRLSADHRWILSGTTPTHDFPALRTIATFLGIHLGVHDHGESLSPSSKKGETNVEQFHSFREVHTNEWHARRNILGQNFLNRFVRQNIAEIDEIPWSDELQVIQLPAAERAIYLELEHHLHALDMTIRRGKKTQSDRERRFAKVLGESSTAEEALLKRCSHFDLETKDGQDAMTACEAIVKERTEQRDECKKDLLRHLKVAVGQAKAIGEVPGESLFQEYVRLARKQGYVDQEITGIVNSLLDEANAPAPRDIVAKPQQRKTTQAEWKHREHTHEIRRITKELSGRVQSLRYFTAIRDLQRSDENRRSVYCPGCNEQAIPLHNAAILSSCGHTGCVKCVTESAKDGRCVHMTSSSCRATTHVRRIVEARTLGEDHPRDGRGHLFGKKLEDVTRLITERIPPDDRILLFVQFPDLMQKVVEALTANHVKCLQIKGDAKQKSQSLMDFQNGIGQERVLLLDVMDESASGANLTVANHAIFLSPLLAPTQEIYEAIETQAIGRVRRYGQLKKVTIWRFLTWDTMDTVIYKQRTNTEVPGPATGETESGEDVEMAAL